VGYLVLEGGAEFGGRMAEPDRRALALAGGPEAPIVIIPTAAAPDHNHERAGQNGRRWFTSLGARQVHVAPLLDRTSANEPGVAAMLRDARLIYLLGGFTHYLGQTLQGSLAWQAAREAHAAGAVIAGSSAGAMVMCQFYYDPQRNSIEQGLALVANACVLPHHDTFGQRWAPRLTNLLPQAVLIGLDERTGLINDGPNGAWTVYGQGSVTLYRHGQAQRVASGTTVSLDEKPQ